MGVIEAAHLLGIEVRGVVLVLAFPFTLKTEGNHASEKVMQGPQDTLNVPSSI